MECHGLRPSPDDNVENHRIRGRRASYSKVTAGILKQTIVHQKLCSVFWYLLALVLL